MEEEFGKLEMTLLVPKIVEFAMRLGWHTVIYYKGQWGLRRPGHGVGSEWYIMTINGDVPKDLEDQFYIEIMDQWKNP